MAVMCPNRLTIRQQAPQSVHHIFPGIHVNACGIVSSRQLLVELFDVGPITWRREILLPFAGALVDSINRDTVCGARHGGSRRRTIASATSSSSISLSAMLAQDLDDPAASFRRVHTLLIRLLIVCLLGFWVWP